MRRIYLARGTREHRTPWADAVWWIGRADVGIKFRRNGQRRDGMVCHTMNAVESPIVSGIKEERKNQPARKEEQAGVLID